MRSFGSAQDKRPRLLFLFIVLLTVFAVWVNFPVGQARIFKTLNIKKTLLFRQGLDLKGGSSVTFKADMSKTPADQKKNALDSAKAVIEKRVNLFGVSEPIVTTSISNNDYRIILELPGITNTNEAISLVGQTAQLTFWEQGASSSAKQADPLLYPLGAVQALGQNPRATNLSGSDLKQTSVTFDSNTGKPQVQLVFTNDGANKFAEITGKNVGKVIAIVLDSQVIEAPRVNQQIIGRDAVITGNFTPESAKALSTQLNAGALPVPLIPLAQQTIGPTLGQSSLRMSLFAAVLGFFIIVVFMVVLYGGLGVIASLALILYTAFVLAIFKLSNLTPYGITLTLSGIAGFVLSIGMAVDANILIFERMKEERRLGKPKDAVIEIGFSRAWSSIRDSNISTLITSAILYQFGTGMIRGFALVLAIGVLVSMFSAVVVTRTLLRFVYGYNR